jgi:uncharacterized protein
VPWLINYPERAKFVSELATAIPLSNRDYEFFYQGLREQMLLVQACKQCAAVRNPPGPMCPKCQSLQWHAMRCSGRGVVHSYTIHYHPPLPGFDSPHTILLVDMQEGFRLIGAARGIPAEQIEIGMPVEVEYFQRGNLATFGFKPATAAARN